MPRRVLITVGEVSGDRNAANFARELKKLDPAIIIDGLGGNSMREADVNVHHDTVSRATMGLRAFLRAAEVRRYLAWTRHYYRTTPPDLHVSVDSWTMNCHFARIAKKTGKPVLYYIAPQAWASRPGRVKRMRRDIDCLACILPFEQEWFSSRGVNATFVGHPLFDHLSMRVDASTTKSFDPTAPVIGILPGSRRGIVRNNLPSLLDAAAIIRREFPGTRFLIPTTQNADEVVRKILIERAGAGASTGGFTATLDAFDEMVPRCDLCLTVSGTAALHVAAHNVPLIVVYRGSWVLWNLIGRWLINARTFSLVNILANGGRIGAGPKIAPEFVPWHGPAEPVAQCAIDYLRHPEKLAEQRRRLFEMIEPLATAGASKKVAELAMELMNGPTTSSPDSPLSSVIRTNQ